MIDYWEAIGRLATYPELDIEFQNLEACTQKRAPVTILAKDQSVAGSGLLIHEGDFRQVQDFIKGVLTEQSLSLIAAGELIWDFSFPESRGAMTQLNGLIPQAEPKLYGPATAYFIALGRVVVDGDLRQTLAAINSDTDLVPYFSRLSENERKKLVTLLKNTEFIQHCDTFGRRPWEEGCIGAGSYSAGYVQPTGMRAEERNGKFFVAKPGAQWAKTATTATYK